MKKLVLALVLLGSTASAKVLPDRVIYLRGLNSLVKITVLHGDRMSCGSGSVVGHNADGYQIVLTAAHLFDAGDPNPTIVSESRDLPYEKLLDPSSSSDAILISLDEKNDLALLRLTKHLDRETLPLGEPLRQTDPLYYFGNADEAPTTFGRGVLTRVNYPSEDAAGYAQYTGFAWPGMSGGPVLDQRGRLVGVIAAVNRVDDPGYTTTVLVPQIAYLVPERSIAALLAKNAVLP